MSKLRLFYSKNRKALLHGVSWVITGFGLALLGVVWLIKSDRINFSAQPVSPTTVTQKFSTLPPALITSRHLIELKKLPAPENSGFGGALASAAGVSLFMARSGKAYRIQDGLVTLTALPPPFDLEASEAFYEREFSKTAVGAKDLIMSREGPNWRLFVSALVKVEDNCLALRVLTTTFPDAAWQRSELMQDVAWEHVYTTKPCLTSDMKSRPVSSGGALTMSEDGQLFLMSGDFQMMRAGGGDAVAQDKTMQYGKVLAIDPKSGEGRILSLGHRNSNGLIAATDGDLWMIEHGPMGGDELNVIKQDKNYGWPVETYGTGYFGFSWAEEDKTGTSEHAEFTTPAYAWVPSIAPSDVVQIKGNGFTAWKGDLLVSSLKAQSLFRIKVQDGVVRFVEPIFVGTRIRSLTETEDGRILLLTDRRDLIIEMHPKINGDRELSDIPEALERCAGCHQVSPNQTGTFAAPTLIGIVGRTIASDPTFAYSEGLSSLSGRWTDNRLHDYLADPVALANDTTMPAMDASFAVRKRIIEALHSIAEVQ